MSVGPPRLSASAGAILLGAVLASGLAGCSLVPGEPSVGAVTGCTPAIESVLCRRIAETAFRAFAGPALIAREVDVSTWEACDLEGVVAMSGDAARDGRTCYSVMASGMSGGRQVAKDTFDGGTPVTIEGLVWVTTDGGMHAVTKTTTTDISR